jgi:hypothetical protein
VFVQITFVCIQHEIRLDGRKYNAQHEAKRDACKHRESDEHTVHCQMTDISVVGDRIEGKPSDYKNADVGHY